MGMLIFAIILLVPGIVLLYWINRRKFYRRNVAGMETFSSYETSVFIRFLERVGKLLGYALIILGLLFMLIHFTPPKKKPNTETTYENNQPL